MEIFSYLEKNWILPHTHRILTATISFKITFVPMNCHGNNIKNEEFVGAEIISNVGFENRPGPPTAFVYVA